MQEFVQSVEVPEVEDRKFVIKIRAGFELSHAKYGGVTQYLRTELESEDRRSNWLHHLWNYYEEQEDCLYWHDSVIPAVDERDRSTTPCEILHLA